MCVFVRMMYIYYHFNVCSTAGRHVHVMVRLWCVCVCVCVCVCACVCLCVIISSIWTLCVSVCLCVCTHKCNDFLQVFSIISLWSRLHFLMSVARRHCLTVLLCTQTWQPSQPVFGNACSGQVQVSTSIRPYLWGSVWGQYVTWYTVHLENQHKTILWLPPQVLQLLHYY